MRTIRSPYNWLSNTHQLHAFAILLPPTFVLMFCLSILDRPLENAAAPQGIVSFELAGNMAAAQAILESWGADGRVYAGLSLGLDYLYMVAYAGAIGLGCMLVVHGLGKRTGAVPPAIGIALAWALIAAGLLDAVENYALIQLLLGSSQLIWPPIARGCALLKFALVALGLLYFVFGGLIAIVAGITRRVQDEVVS